MDPNELLPIRVQYLPDTDPYNCMTTYPIPIRAPTYSFACSTPLATQLGAILRLLGAPHRVRHIKYYISVLYRTKLCVVCDFQVL